MSYIPAETYTDFSLGGVDLIAAGSGAVRIGVNNLNSFGKQLGYEEDDILLRLNDSLFTNQNQEKRIDELYGRAKEGDMLTVKVKRRDETGKWQMKTMGADGESSKAACTCATIYA